MSSAFEELFLTHFDIVCGESRQFFTSLIFVFSLLTFCYRCYNLS